MCGPFAERVDRRFVVGTIVFLYKKAKLLGPDKKRALCTIVVERKEMCH
jgi:hypothetical protein